MDINLSDQSVVVDNAGCLLTDSWESQALSMIKTGRLFSPNQKWDKKRNMVFLAEVERVVVEIWIRKKIRLCEFQCLLPPLCPMLTEELVGLECLWVGAVVADVS